MMKKIFLSFFGLLLAMSIQAQSDVVSVKDAIKIFQGKTLAKAKRILENQGYTYKGVSTDKYGKDYNWVKNMNLTKDFFPASFKKGNSSLVLLAENGTTLYVYLFNRAAFNAYKKQAKTLGYEMGEVIKSTPGTTVCTKEGQPTISFIELQQPLPYCIQITE